MNIVNTTPTTTYATGLSVTTFADWLKADYNSDQTIIDLAFNGAVQYIEGLVWMKFVGETVTGINNVWGDGEYEMNVSGTLSALTVTYFDENNASQTLSLDSDEYWLEQVDAKSSILNIKPTTYPDLYERKDAIKAVLTLTPSDTTISASVIIMIYQIGAYFYDCRVNDKEPQMTVVEKMAVAIRQKEY